MYHPQAWIKDTLKRGSRTPSQESSSAKSSSAKSSSAKSSSTFRKPFKGISYARRFGMACALHPRKVFLTQTPATTGRAAFAFLPFTWKGRGEWAMPNTGVGDAKQISCAQRSLA